MFFLVSVFVILCNFTLAWTTIAIDHGIHASIANLNSGSRFMVSLRKVLDQDLKTTHNLCTGILVTYQHVITSAFFVSTTPGNNSVLMQSQESRIIASTARLSIAIKMDVITRDVDTISLHPNFIYNQYYNIAVAIDNQLNPVICDGFLAGFLTHSRNSTSSGPEVFIKMSDFHTWVTNIIGSSPKSHHSLYIIALITTSQIAFAALIS